MLEQSILAEAQLNSLLSSRPDQKHDYIKDSPHHVTLTKRLSLAQMKQIQHQLALALGDKDTSSDTVQMKQVSLLKEGLSRNGGGKQRTQLTSLVDGKSHFGSDLV